MRSSTSAGRQWPALVVGLAGCALIIVGTLLPWMSLFAGLRKMNGLTGMNGSILIGLALVIGLCIVIVAYSRSAIAMRFGTYLALATTGFALWLTKGLLDVVSREGRDVMLIASAGPGLFVVTAGAMIALASLRRTRAA